MGGVRIMNVQHPPRSPFPGVLWTRYGKQGSSKRAGTVLKQASAQFGSPDVIFFAGGLSFGRLVATDAREQRTTRG